MKVLYLLSPKPLSSINLLVAPETALSFNTHLDLLSHNPAELQTILLIYINRTPTLPS